MESRARSPKEMGREDLCHEPLGDRSLQLSAPVALQGVLACKLRKSPLWGLGVPAGHQQSLGAGIPPAGPRDWSRLRYKKTPKLQRDGLGHAGVTGDSKSGSCLSVHPSESQPATPGKGISSPLPLFFPTHPKAGTLKGAPVFDQRERLCCCFGDTRGIYCCDSSWALQVTEAALPWV